jgi:hypothetical protein
MHASYLDSKTLHPLSEYKVGFVNGYPEKDAWNVSDFGN